MNFLTAAHTDVGTRKATNQDSYLVHQAHTEYGTILLAVMCDGMGGLAKGEVASARVVSAFSQWFSEEFPSILYDGMEPERLGESWQALAQRENNRIRDYGQMLNVDMGSTCTVFLSVDDTYYIMNVGDSRIYLISDNVYQLTKDQTYVQREMDMGRMTYEESLVSPHRSVLLQCIGASAYVEPDFYTGQLLPGQHYLLCCDGFRHVIDPSEFLQVLGPQSATSHESMQEGLVQLTELNKQRGETDNISAILIRTI